MKRWVIKTGFNAQKTSYFRCVYNFYKRVGVSNLEFGTVELHPNGRIVILLFISSPTQKEKDDFFNQTIEFYQKELQNGTYCISVRGNVSINVVFDPTQYPRETIDNILKRKKCTTFLVDTNTNEIIGIRLFTLNEKVYSEFHKSCVTTLERGLTTNDCTEGLRDFVLPISNDRFLQTSRYIGSEESSTIVKNLIMFDTEELYVNT